MNLHILYIERMNMVFINVYFSAFVEREEFNALF
jgi:hypothetical protein